MFVKVCCSKNNFLSFLKKRVSSFALLAVLIAVFTSSIYSQINQAYFSPQPTQNSLNSTVFRQEIARMEITVTRGGRTPLSLTQVPRVQRGDVIKLRLLDEPVNGIKIDQTQWDWTLLVAFINPSHRMTKTEDNPLRKMATTVDGNKEFRETGTGTVSEEIQFRKRGWYKQYSFLVPYDSQPVFFLYPKPKYRSQLMKIVNSKYDDIRKLGEKTIELADAYSKIDTFLNEMQTVLNRNAQMYGYGNNSSISNPYGSTYNPYNTYNPYGTTGTTNDPSKTPTFGLQTVPALNQLVEGLAKSFNIQLPSCWNSGLNYNPTYGSNYGSYSPTYNSGYSSYGYGSSAYGSGYGNNGAMMDFINRSQCVARSVNLQDFDISLTKMWQQGGVFLAAELQKKYPQLAFYINIAAVAVDFILRVFQRSPLKIVPTIVQANDPQGGFGNYSAGAMYGNQYTNNYTNNSTPPGGNQSPNQNPVKISLFADSQPSEGQFVTAYPIVVHKWQANPDPEVISLYAPILSEACLHAGTNILKSIDLTNQWSEDVYSRDFRLLISSSNGFRKEFPLRKNIGLGGWELNVTPEDMNQIPKINMALEAELLGTRGFNEIKSPKFNLPISLGGSYTVTPESQMQFAVGGKRTITLRHTLGNCRCLQQVVYKPSFGGQFVFENLPNQNAPNGLNYSSDGTEVSFDIDTTNFQPGIGTLEFKTYGGETQQMQLTQSSPQGSNSATIKLYPAPPTISAVDVRRGDRQITITGERLEQLQSVLINGKRAIFKGGTQAVVSESSNQQSLSNNQNTIQNQWNTIQSQSTAAPPTPAANSAIIVAGQYQNAGQTQRVAAFEDPNTRINSKTIMLELDLEDNRSYSYPNQFMVGIARPTIKANNQNEIEGTFLNSASVKIENDQTATPESLTAKSKGQRRIDRSTQIDLSGYPMVSIDRNAMTVAVQNLLTDYGFKNENLSIETRIENANTNPNELPKVSFDVLDTDNLRLNFTFNRVINKNLSGRRLQFRIVDRERGNSDWYSIKQTFVRVPQIESVVCTGGANKQCELKGEGLDYIAQVSTDEGRNWFPQIANSPIQVQPTQDGKTVMRIPMLVNQKFLQIKLRDYPNTEGLTVSNFILSNRGSKN